MRSRIIYLGAILVGLLVVEHWTSGAPTRIHLARLLSFYPIVGFGALLVLYKNLDLPRRFVLLCIFLLLATGIELAVSSLAISKLEFSLFFYLTGIAGHLIAILTTSGFVLGIENLVGRSVG